MTPYVTLFYDANENEVVENHPEGWIEFDDDGSLVIDLDEAPRREKVTSLIHAAQNALDGQDEYELTSEATWEWVGDA